MIKYAIEMPDFKEADLYQQQTQAKIQQLSAKMQQAQQNLNEHINAVVMGQGMDNAPDEDCIKWFRDWVGIIRGIEATQKEIDKQTADTNKKYDEAVDSLLSRMGADGWPFVNIISVAFSENAREAMDVFVFAKAGSYFVDEMPVEYKRVNPGEFEQATIAAQEKIAPNMQEWLRTQAQTLTPQQSGELVLRTREKIAKEAVLSFLNAQAEDGWMFVRFLHSAFVFKKNKA